MKAIADHGARFVGCNIMYLQDGTRAHFMEFLDREFPSMTPRFERLYARTSPPASYQNEVRAMVRVLQDRYGLAKRRDMGCDDSPLEGGAEPEQVGFSF